MKTLQTSLYKSFSKSIFFSIFFILCISHNSFAQEEWDLDAKMGNNLSSAVYIPAMESVLFISGSDLLFYPLGGGEQTTGSVRNFGILPSDWNEITAAVLWSSSTVLLFNGENYVSLDVNEATLSDAKRFPGLPENWKGRLDAAVNWNGDLYFFAGGQYAKYSKKQKSFVEYEMMSKWNGWANIWSEGPQAVVNTEDGSLHFFKDGECFVFNTLDNSFQGTPFRIAEELPPGEDIEEFDEGPPALDIVDQANDDAPPSEISSGSNTENWCLAGVPPGNSDAGLSADVIYMKNGDAGNEMSDDATVGARLAEIKVWGSFVIYGLQTVLETPEGQLIELPVLGKEKGKASSFKLDPDECLTGIEGTHIGAEGRFIHTISFKTSKGQSPVFGTRKGNKPYSVEIPNGTAFYGFAIKSKAYLTSVGIKYVYFDDADIATTHSTTLEPDGEANETPRDEWSDAYEDFTRELTELSWGSETAVKPLPACDWLGIGVDILTLDPLDIGKSDTKTPPIELTVSDERGGPENKNVLPFGSEYKTLGSGDEDRTGKWVEKYSDFTKQYGGSVGVSGGLGPVAGSMSASFSNMNNIKVGSKEIYLTRFVERKLFSVEMKLNWRQEGFGKARQKLNLDFRNMVEHLPVPDYVPNKLFESMQKGKPLPSSVENIRDAYEVLLNEYGTHFVENAVFGGKYVSNSIVTKQDYENTRQNENAFKASVQGAVGPATLGTDAAFNYGEKSTVGTKEGSLKAKKYIQGAAGSAKYDTWDAELKNSPVVIEVEVKGTYELLTDIFFPNDPNIDKKRKVLKMVMEQYVKDNAPHLVQPDGKFFTDPKPVEYKYTLTIDNIKNTGSENCHFYGDISCDFIDDGFLGQNMWAEAEPYAVEVLQSSIYQIGESYTVKVKEGDKGYFIVTGNLHERGWWPDYSVSIGEHSQKVYLSEIPQEGKTFKVKDFRNGWKKAEIEFTITKEMVR